jgi:hypothetical protein
VKWKIGFQSTLTVDERFASPQGEESFDNEFHLTGSDILVAGVEILGGLESPACTIDFGARVWCYWARLLGFNLKSTRTLDY